MPKQPDFPIQIFYDGTCSVCATEIEHYLRQEYTRLIFIVISVTMLQGVSYR